MTFLVILLALLAATSVVATLRAIVTDGRPRRPPMSRMTDPELLPPAARV